MCLTKHAINHTVYERLYFQGNSLLFINSTQLTKLITSSILPTMCNKLHTFFLQETSQGIIKKLQTNQIPSYPKILSCAIWQMAD